MSMTHSDDDWLSLKAKFNIHLFHTSLSKTRRRFLMILLVQGSTTAQANTI